MLFDNDYYLGVDVRIYLNKISEDAAVGMIQMLTDNKLYDLMQSRHVNFRPSDLSSVWKDTNKWRYFRRLFQEGDEQTIKRITIEKPILSLTSHNILVLVSRSFLD